jgi:hypothetical protein
VIASKSAIQKVVAEYDLPKSPLYETLRERPDVTNLFTERDNTAYKKKAWVPDLIIKAQS